MDKKKKEEKDKKTQTRKVKIPQRFEETPSEKEKRIRKKSSSVKNLVDYG